MPEPVRTRRPYAARVPMEVRREQLLDAAIQIIVRDGYGHASIEAIAREAGVTRPVVYGAFDGLDQLYAALLDRQQARALEQLYAALPDLTAIGDLHSMAAGTVRRLVDAVTSDPITWRPVLFARFGAPPNVRARVDADWERVRAQIESLTGVGLTLAGIKGVDAAVLSHAIMAVLEHFGRLLLDQPDLFDVEQLVGAVTGVLRGVRL
jgi:AcrR family transcriptional regulator